MKQSHPRSRPGASPTLKVSDSPTWQSPSKSVLPPPSHLRHDPRAASPMAAQRRRHIDDLARCRQAPRDGCHGADQRGQPHRGHTASAPAITALLRFCLYGQQGGRAQRREADLACQLADLRLFLLVAREVAAGAGEPPLQLRQLHVRQLRM